MFSDLQTVRVILSVIKQILFLCYFVVLDDLLLLSAKLYLMFLFATLVLLYDLHLFHVSFAVWFVAVCLRIQSHHLK